MTRPDAVVFDLGNVLISWDPHPAIAAGVGEEQARSFLAAEDFDFAAWNHAMDGGGSWADAEKEVAASHPHWAEHARAYRANFDASLTGALDDTVAVLRDLHAAGVPVFALTNWSHELFPHALARFGFLSLFEDIVVSGTEGVAKPDTAVFALLERRTGRPLSRCLFIDDKADNVTAAAEAGLDAVLFTGAVQLREDLRARGLPV